MNTTVLIALAVLLFAGCGVVGVPRTADEVAAATGRPASDGYMPADPFLLVGPEIPLGGGAWVQLSGHLGGSDLEVHCLLSHNTVPPNLSEKAYLQNGVELEVVRTRESMERYIQNGSDVFIVRLPKVLILDGPAVPIRFRVYGPYGQRTIEIPVWYVEGFRRTAGPALGGRSSA